MCALRGRGGGEEVGEGEEREGREQLVPFVYNECTRVLTLEYLIVLLRTIMEHSDY